MNKPIIEIRNLSKSYTLGTIGATSLKDEVVRWAARIRGAASAKRELFWALNGVSFSVEAGEVVGVIGRNGAGKSTLLKLLSRVTRQTSGEITLRGRVASLLEVGTGFHPDLSGRDNIFLNGAILGMRKSEIHRKFDEIVAFAEVEQFIDTPVKRYSSGMYVRLAFAVAAHLDPEILIVDEVLAVGDAQFQKKCIGKMGEVREQGKTVLIVSHNMAVINNLCSRAVLLDSGCVVADGPADQVTQQYLVGTRDASGQTIWPDPATAPGNGIVRLKSVRIFQETADAPTAELDISKETSVEICYWNCRPGEVLYAAMLLRDHQGSVVLASSSNRKISLTDDTWFGRPRPVGVYKSICRIPASFLNDKFYSVTAIVGTGEHNTQILEENAVTFQVHDTGEMRANFYGEWLGTVRPKLAWSTDKIEHSPRNASTNAF